MTTPRKIVNLALAELAVTPEEFLTLQALAALHKGDAWNTEAVGSPLGATEKALVKRFKKQLKENLFGRFQGAHCCYCAIELPNHQGKYDLEHIVAKNGRTSVVFHLGNLALSCGACNTNKGEKKTTVSQGSDLDAVPEQTAQYLLVHPQLDEWTDHFEFDRFRRVSAKYVGPATKAMNTIEMCGIDKLNAIRLAHHFDWLRLTQKRRKDWLSFYHELFLPMDLARKKKLGKFAKTLLDSKGDPAAEKIYDLLKNHIDSLVAGLPKK